MEPQQTPDNPFGFDPHPPVGQGLIARNWSRILEATPFTDITPPLLILLRMIFVLGIDLAFQAIVSFPAHMRLMPLADQMQYKKRTLDDLGKEIDRFKEELRRNPETLFETPEPEPEPEPPPPSPPSEHYTRARIAIRVCEMGHVDIEIGDDSGRRDHFGMEPEDARHIAGLLVRAAHAAERGTGHA